MQQGALGSETIPGVVPQLVSEVKDAIVPLVETTSKDQSEAPGIIRQELPSDHPLQGTIIQRKKAVRIFGPTPDMTDINSCRETIAKKSMNCCNGTRKLLWLNGNFERK